jgi:hypothetical protein
MSFPITLDEIERAYAETGMQPAERTWSIARNPDKQLCACPLTAVVAVRHGMDVAHALSYFGSKTDFAAKHLSITHGQVQSFILGFDGCFNDDGTAPSDPEAYVVGRAARKKFLLERSPA